jgi:hypothetical protein
MLPVGLCFITFGFIADSPQATNFFDAIWNFGYVLIRTSLYFSFASIPFLVIGVRQCKAKPDYYVGHKLTIVGIFLAVISIILVLGGLAFKRYHTKSTAFYYDKTVKDFKPYCQTFNGNLVCDEISFDRKNGVICLNLRNVRKNALPAGLDKGESIYLHSLEKFPDQCVQARVDSFEIDGRILKVRKELPLELKDGEKVSIKIQCEQIPQGRFDDNFVILTETSRGKADFVVTFKSYLN